MSPWPRERRVHIQATLPRLAHAQAPLWLLERTTPTPLEPSPQPPQLTVTPTWLLFAPFIHLLLRSQLRRQVQSSLERLVVAALKEHPVDSDEMIKLVPIGFLCDAYDARVVNQAIQRARSLPPARAPSIRGSVNPVGR
jgi:hypothetical protein